SSSPERSTEMPLVFGCIAPHGGIAVPELAGDRPELAAKTREAMFELGRRLEAREPDTVVVLTPHGIRVEGTMAISVSERAAGTRPPARPDRAQRPRPRPQCRRSLRLRPGRRRVRPADGRGGPGERPAPPPAHRCGSDRLRQARLALADAHPGRGGRGRADA